MSDSNSDGMPELLTRETAGDSDESSNGISPRIDLMQRHDSSSSNSSAPPLHNTNAASTARRRRKRKKNKKKKNKNNNRGDDDEGNNSAGSSSDDSSIPRLLTRGHASGSEKDSSSSSEDDRFPPDLVHRPPGDESGDDSSFDNDDDDDDDSDDDVPALATRSYSGDDESRSSGSSDIPGLMHRSQADSENDGDSSDSSLDTDDSSVGNRRPQMPYGRRQPQPPKTTNKKNNKSRGPAQASSASRKQKKDTTTTTTTPAMPKRARVDRLKQLQDQAATMKNSALKKEAAKLGIENITEKKDLVRAYAKAMFRATTFSENGGCPDLKTVIASSEKEDFEAKKRQSMIAATERADGNKKASQLRKMLKDQFGIEDASLKSQHDLLHAYATAVADRQLQRESDKQKDSSKNNEDAENEAIAKKMSCLGLRKVLDSRGVPTEFLRGKEQLVKVFLRTAPRNKKKDIPMPTPMDVRDPPKNGCFVLSPQRKKQTQQQQQSTTTTTTAMMDLTYAYPDGNGLKRTGAYATYKRGSSILVPGPMGTVWVYFFDEEDGEKDGDGQWALDLIKSNDLKIPVHRRLDKFSQLTVLKGKIWALKPVHSDSSPSLDLIYIPYHVGSAKIMRSNIPVGSRLLEDQSGGVWVFFPKTANQAPVLCHFAVADAKADEALKCNRFTVNEKVLLASDSARTGVLGLEKQQDGTAVLSHYSVNGSERKEQALNVQFDVVQSILDDGGVGALIHYKAGSEWKLASASFGTSELVDQYTCPKNSQLSTNNGRGAVWALKKAGKKGADRGLLYLNGENTLELSEKYLAGSVLGGAME